MPNFLEMLRMQNLYGPKSMMMDQNPYPQQNTFMSPTVQPFNNIDFGGSTPLNVSNMPDSSISNRMNQMYTPETAAGDRYNTMVDDYPERPTDQGWLRKIAAIGLSTLSDMYGAKKGEETFNNVMYPGYENKVKKYKDTIGPAKEAAVIEKSNNVNERTLAYQTISAELRQQAQESKDKNDATNAQIRQQRADIYDFKSKNPNMKIVTTKGGNVQAINPQTGETIDTGIPTGSLSELDKLNLQHENSLEDISARGDESRETARVRGEESRLTKQTSPAINPNIKPKSTTIKPDSPAATRTRQLNTARELVNTDPSLKPFIKFDGNNFEIEAPSEGFFGHKGPTDEQFKKIKKSIYGEGNLPVNQPNRTGISTTDTTKTKTSGDTEKRNRAIEILKKSKKPITDRNIAFVMGKI